jgi:hypothetical protein
LWEIAIGIYIAVAIYPFFEEWRQRRVDKGRLANMRRHSALGHRWDVSKGEWKEE